MNALRRVDELRSHVVTVVAVVIVLVCVRHDNIILCYLPIIIRETHVAYSRLAS